MAKDMGHIARHFAAVSDPRVERQKDHKLIDVIMVAVCAVLAGADTYVDIAAFGAAKEGWLKGFLELPNGIPSHDTFGRVFALINPGEFQAAFAQWMKSAVELTDGQVVAVDGKTNRRTFSGLTRALHLVSAFATANGVALGQVNTDQKSNEITAIPELLKLLDLKGCLVTADAMGCQTEIAADIVSRGGDYLLAVKGNQGNLHDDVKALFADGRIPRDTDATEDRGHGRIDRRSCEVISLPEALEGIRRLDAWPSLHAVAKVTSERTAVVRGETKTSVESRYFICSDEEPKASRIQSAVRAHWGIENNLHWVIDMAFREDESRIRTGNAPANMAVMRHVALNLIRGDRDRKVGVKASRLKAAWGTDYLEKLLGGLTG
jgi:predicted transposase YbfD/YdcC